MENEKAFETENLFLASFLHAKGLDITSIRQKDDGKIAIGFEGREAEILKLKYYNGGNVEATRFVESYVTLRKMVKTEVKEQN